LLDNADARRTLVDAGERVVARLGGALDRTLSALEPYLLQVRLETGAADA
jgi:3-deoxy-D-manno-octulosonic-acid transferase